MADQDRLYVVVCHLGVHSKQAYGWLQVSCSSGKSEQSQELTLIGGCCGSSQLSRYKNSLAANETRLQAWGGKKYTPGSYTKMAVTTELYLDRELAP